MSPAAPWLRFYGTMPAHLNYPSGSMFSVLANTARQYPNHIAYEFMGRKTTYAAFIKRVEITAAAFLAMGIDRGDRVTLCIPNTPQGVDCFYALNRIGAIPNMIHPLSAPEEILFYLQNSNSKAILTIDTFYDKVSAVLQDLSFPCTLLLTSIKDALPLHKRLLYPFTKTGKATPALPRTGVVLWRDFLKTGDTSALPPDTGGQQDCAAVLYSGGTTGNTKGIMLSNGNFNALALQTLAASGYASIVGDTMLSVMPMFHGFGLGIGIHTALVGGGCCILVPRFNVKSYARLLKTKKPNFIPGVPTLFAALLQAKGLQKANLSFLKGVFAGGDSLSPALKKQVDAFLKEHHSPVPIREGYGTTECVTASCLTPLQYAKEGSIGIPFPDTYYTIVTPDTVTPLPPGEEGEICLTGPSVMLGYVDQPDETNKVLRRHADGLIWLHTGDLGVMDEDGFVYFRQRIKRVIISSGYNIYPSQIEAVLDRHPEVAASCVIGVPDPYRGQRVRAYVIPTSDEPSEDLCEKLLAFCNRYIAKYALPREIEFRRELPKTLVGKIAYRKLEEEVYQKSEDSHDKL